jgi:hypothetical protein
LVEQKEFRDLLLFLKEDLKDEDVPKRTKMRDLVMVYCKAYFKRIKEDMAVSTCLAFLSDV